MKLNVSVDVSTWRDRLALFDKRQRLITAIALTKTAKDVQAMEIHAMTQVFDRPTRWTLGALRIEPATPEKLVARVAAKDWIDKGTPAWKYLTPQVFGGERGLKSHERTLNAAGFLPTGMRAVPARGMKLDQHGNMAMGTINQILSQLRLQMYGGYESRESTDKKRAKRSRARQGGRIFVGAPGGGKLPLGVWQKTNEGGLRPLLIFIKSPAYRPRFPFFDVADRAGRFAFPVHLETERNRERPMKAA